MRKVFFFFILTLFSCKDFGNPVNIQDLAKYTFTDDIYPIFADNCKNCHPAEYSTYDQILGSGHMIIGDALSSELFIRIELPDENPKNMPLGAGTLSVEQIELIERWINDGALR
jgi:hypothetical protein